MKFKDLYNFWLWLLQCPYSFDAKMRSVERLARNSVLPSIVSYRCFHRLGFDIVIIISNWGWFCGNHWRWRKYTIPISRSRSIENATDRREGVYFQIPFLATLSAPTPTTAPKISPSNSLKDELFRTASRKSLRYPLWARTLGLSSSMLTSDMFLSFLTRSKFQIANSTNKSSGS